MGICVFGRRLKQVTICQQHFPSGVVYSDGVVEFLWVRVLSGGLGLFIISFGFEWVKWDEELEVLGYDRRV